eukprot:scaffold1202_cov384-Prasinococcus_capsulatus_cf.AAC.16
MGVTVPLLNKSVLYAQHDPSISAHAARGCDSASLVCDEPNLPENIVEDNAHEPPQLDMVLVHLLQVANLLLIHLLDIDLVRDLWERIHARERLLCSLVPLEDRL